MYQQQDRSSSLPSSEIAEGLTQDTEAPAAASHIHDVFAEDGKKFGADSRTQKSRQPKGRSSSSPRRTNPVCDRSLSFNNPSQDLDRTPRALPRPEATAFPLAVPMERDGGGPSPEMEDQRLEPTGSDPTAPNPPSRKRSGPPTGSHVLSPKRSCGSSRVVARRARETKKTSTCSDSHKEERLRHAFPLHCRDKEWDVVNLGISIEEDGSLKCELLWAPTTVSVSTLKGELLGRAEELVRRDHGAET